MRASHVPPAAQIRRIRNAPVMSAILPMLVMDYMLFTVFFMERDDLAGRMSTIVMIVLSMVALQFTFNLPPSQYFNAIQQVGGGGLQHWYAYCTVCWRKL